MIKSSETKGEAPWLAAQGFRVIRFWNDDVLKRMDSVLQKILEVLEEISSERKVVEDAAREDGSQS